ncbi:hypothetical protein KKC1_09460 [Calderihabitans maritimus]|uniref:Uncharacterized protein n=1 Tax=Calderihabitans maritimus TaxID=1246530 RepID=A0A1Z5HQH9_9FIRM|nr:hypothetical protein KKC1_09460 [Calderihabitans maritimus]
MEVKANEIFEIYKYQKSNKFVNGISYRDGDCLLGVACRSLGNSFCRYSTSTGGSKVSK